MAAAVADYKPVAEMNRKVKKDQGGLTVINLETTQDILGELAQRKKSDRVGPRFTIGFAAETENLLENASLKMKKKELDLIVANDVSRKDSGFGSDKNQVTLIWKDGRKKEQPLMEKSAVSDVIIQEAAKLMEPA